MTLLTDNVAILGQQPSVTLRAVSLWTSPASALPPDTSAQWKLMDETRPP